MKAKCKKNNSQPACVRHGLLPSSAAQTAKEKKKTKEPLDQIQQHLLHWYCYLVQGTYATITGMYRTVPGTYGAIPGMYISIPDAHGTVLDKYGTRYSTLGPTWYKRALFPAS